MTTKFKIIAGAFLAVLLYFMASYYGLNPATKVRQSVVPQSVELPSADESALPATGSVKPIELPSTKPANVSGPEIRHNVWAWNAQMGLFFANGGPVTTSGSLMQQHKVKLKIVRQDNTELSKTEQIKFANALSEGQSEPADGIHYVTIMGDGSAAYLASINEQLKKLGDDYRAEIIGSVGYSRGEDGMYGPQAWKDDPEAVKGGVCAGVLRDGDWNLAMFKLTQNGIKNNPDERTYDPDALNWIAADDYIKAPEMYIAGYTEERVTVINGKRGPKKKIGIDCVVTWTPGDVKLAMKKGGLVPLITTRENPYQMPAVIIGIHKWNVAHRKLVAEYLAAIFEGSDQVRNFGQALNRAGTASYAIYKEESPAYWIKYYKGVTEKDKTGVPVALGGSTVANLADNLLLFGLSAGSGGIDSSLFKATYEGFGNIAKQQYPKLMPDFPLANIAADTSYLEDLAKRSDLIPVAETVEFTESGPIAKEDIVAKRNWSIQFDTSKATLTPESEKTLTDLYNQLVIGAALAVEIEGHTDNVGDPATNQTLSEQRAFAVKEYLEAKAPTLFPENRVSVQSFGQTRPLVPNTTPENRAKNRRVTVILGKR